MVYKTCSVLSAEYLPWTVRLIWDLVQVPNLKLKSLFMTDIQQPTHDVICKPSHIAPRVPKSPASRYTVHKQNKQYNY